jgi:hypothetical protein
MGMQQHLGKLYQCDTFLLTTEQLVSIETLSGILNLYSDYFLLQKFESCKIGIPYVVDQELWEPCPGVSSAFKSKGISFEWFYYLDLSTQKQIGKYNHWTFPKVHPSKDIYIKCSHHMNWEHFLGSIWDFIKNEMNVILLDTNKVLTHPKHEKIMKALALRGVLLGFHGSFPVKWWESQKKMIKKLAYLELVDFWQSRCIDSKDKAFEKEIAAKVYYQHCKING